MATIEDMPVQKDEQTRLLESLRAKNLAPLWTVMDALVSQFPAPKSTPTVWEYDEIRPDLIKAGQVVDEEEAERRVLMLVNPSMKAPYTTDTLYAGLQLVNPGETAPAHKHVAFALRYIIEGKRGFTAVEGEKMYMEKGDMILTPSWNWHDHGHEGEGPMIWLDGLDLPLFQALPTNFAEQYHEKRYPSKPKSGHALTVLKKQIRVVDSNKSLRFPWAPVKAALDAAPSPHAMYHYKKPDGSEVSYTLNAQAERITAGSSSPVRRDTCSYVFHCASGQGSTRILTASGTETCLEWKANDTFAIPAWSRITHTVTGTENAYLFAFSDKPLLQSLGMYRRE
ncbi:hypothetical protein LTR99_001211 [Exophiala xenobiotica]|uniref:Cupin type-2 domain-containing protein n=1 Tax=Vermiconidia calcicola TaxID=1690605 RepID=A0AAV9QP48_9PEZI|nr:hypothetical protein LTR92_001643 [Exophiala xenobiotica]KAK5545772.1 hypothetical protein LTR25_000782 [Vermiconidia calcicola]KAK5308236.1 hypothetical protein LTR99_001211 [Exophiala xenobiotica]KAK5326335.1 hypothetical protein LTR93_003197 [Exophiala xenobiotica]KAK5397234.1 hypothetical protein LTR79_005871 [Exophiala xenobiotica]